MDFHPTLAENHGKRAVQVEIFLKENRTLYSAVVIPDPQTDNTDNRQQIHDWIWDLGSGQILQFFLSIFPPLFFVGFFCFRFAEEKLRLKKIEKILCGSKFLQRPKISEILSQPSSPPPRLSFFFARRKSSC